MENVTFSMESAVYHVPMCVICGEKEVQIVVNSVGSGYCSPECEASFNEDEVWCEDCGDAPARVNHPGTGADLCRTCWTDEDEDHYWGQRDIDEPFDRGPMDDAEALASAGFGTDEDYGYYGGDE